MPDHDLTHEVLRCDEAPRRSGLAPAGRFEAVFQPDAGFLRADRGIVAHATVARRLRRRIHENEPVRSWKAVGDRVEVETDAGRYEAGALVLAAGAWRESS